MGEPLRLLIVEDSEDDAALLVRTLRQDGYIPDYLCVDTPQAVDAALEETWDIVIADYSIPGFCGLAVLNQLQKRRLDVPFILVSGTIGETVAVEAMRAGAHDYIMKEHLTLVPPAVRRELQEAENRRQHRRAEERFKIVSEVTTDIIYEWDLATDRVEWYGGVEEALGYRSGDIGHTIADWLKCVHPDDRARCREMVERRRKATFSVYEHYRICSRNGTTLYWLDRGAPILDRAGDPVRWVGGCSDVTESKYAEKRLSEYQNRLKSLATELSLAEERERRRVAEGVHDNICQRLALAKLDIQSLQQTFSDVNAIRQLERLCQSVDTIIEQSHTLTFELSNPVLYQVGLEAAVESWLGRNIQGKYGIDYEFNANLKGLRPEEDMSVFLFQSIRELVTNVVKHAESKTLKVRLEAVGDAIEIQVEDDGIGFDVKSKEVSETGGFGLFSVRERLEYLGGRLEVISSSGQGTKVTLVSPGTCQHTPPTSRLDQKE